MFWVVLIAACAGGAAALQILGPPARETKLGAPTPAPTLPAAPAAADKPASPAPPATPAPAQPTPLTPTPLTPAPPAPAPAQPPPPRTQGSIPAPAAALLEALPDDPGAALPRIGPDGTKPMHAYAAAFDAGDPRPRVGLILSGLGMAEADSRQAIDLLPAGVTLAFSVYAHDPEPLLQEARARGHEVLVSIPMEPEGFPLNDEGPHALMTTATAEANRANLLWSLSRIRGAVGATGALGGMRGERLAGVPEMFDPMQQELASRGLLYIDPRPGSPAPAQVTGRSVELVVDEPPSGAAIEQKLAELEHLAREKGSALGLAGPLRPVTLDRIQAWASGLATRGFVLAPVSALVQEPAPAKASME